MLTVEQKFTLQNMTDSQLIRFARILRLTKAVHDWDEECRYVSLLLTERGIINPLQCYDK